MHRTISIGSTYDADEDKQTQDDAEKPQKAAAALVWFMSRPG